MNRNKSRNRQEGKGKEQGKEQEQGQAANLWNLWNVIKRKMDGHKPSNKAELLEFLCQEWCKVIQQQCERLVEIMPRCMKAVIKNQGYSTKY
ncbi:hypothetical protein P4O66_022856 [Electrophorus voltai]|uniref:Uncharacterized protein n=1 Tax=Electrophorus voltai TaxID=2609070 RepID=A0AAD9E3R1_9TELE|nr:hypothetical protein P4O66_022856 [Electrophorus voltai]